MNYEEARAYLNSISAKGNKLGLDAVTDLMYTLGNPQDDLKYIHVGGTNGKGSVMSMMEQVLIDAGYKVGRYLSPVLYCYEEKIQVNKEYISKEDVARLTEDIKDAIDFMEGAGMDLPTIFEVETALSFLYFKEQKCDIVLLEVGMGGREDATNLVTTTVMEVITSISMDHMEFLGDTLEKIAWQKAGIIKPGTVCVSGLQEPSVYEVIKEECEKVGASYRQVEKELIGEAKPGLFEQCVNYGPFADVLFHLGGAYQIKNAYLALEAIRALRDLGYSIPDEAVKSGFANASWHGRFQVLNKEPLAILDGAHNPDAAQQLADSIDLYFKDRKIYYIFGVFSDKEYDKIIRITAPRASYIYTVETKDNVRALPAEALAKAVAPVNPQVEAVVDVTEAIRLAMNKAQKEDVIVLFGSLSWLWEAQAYFGQVQE